MEGVAAASSVIAVVGLAAQVVQGCNYLRGIFDDAKNAPQELHFLTLELRIIENIVSRIHDEQANEEYQHALDFCLEALAKLKSIVEKYALGDPTSGLRRQWGPRLAMALNKDKLEKHMARLREAKGHLEGIHTKASHSELCLKSDNIQGSVVQLSQQHDERSSTMIHGINLLHDHLSEVGQAVGEIRDYCTREQSMLLGRNSEKALSRMIPIFEDVLAKTLALPPNSQLSNSYPRLLSEGTQPREEPIITCKGVLDPNSEETNITVKERLWRQSLPELHRKLAELTHATPGDGRFDDLNLNPDWEVNVNSRGPSASGDIYLRSTSSTYSSSNEIPFSTADLVPKGSLDTMALPIVVTTTDILLLPKSWMQKRGFHLTLRRFEPALAEPAYEIYYSIENFDRCLGKARTLDDIVQLDDAMAESKPDFPKAKRSRKKRNKCSSMVMEAAFKVAFSVKDARKHRLFVRAPLAMSRPMIIRQSFDDEINDVVDLVTLWVEGQLSADFYQDLLHDIAPKTNGHEVEKMSGGSRNSEVCFHRLRVEYAQVLAIAIVRESERPSKSKEHTNYLDRVHQAYWDQFRELAGFWLSATAVNLPFITFNSYCNCSLKIDDREIEFDVVRYLFYVVDMVWMTLNSIHIDDWEWIFIIKADKDGLDSKSRSAQLLDAVTKDITKDTTMIRSFPELFKVMERKDSLQSKSVLPNCPPNSFSNRYWQLLQIPFRGQGIELEISRSWVDYDYRVLSCLSIDWKILKLFQSFEKRASSRILRTENILPP